MGGRSIDGSLNNRASQGSDAKEGAEDGEIDDENVEAWELDDDDDDEDLTKPLGRNGTELTWRPWYEATTSSTEQRSSRLGFFSCEGFPQGCTVLGCSYWQSWGPWVSCLRVWKAT
jgi:hypothetical protein